jgi:hypothetical protein
MAEEAVTAAVAEARTVVEEAVTAVVAEARTVVEEAVTAVVVAEARTVVAEAVLAAVGEARTEAVHTDTKFQTYSARPKFWGGLFLFRYLRNGFLLTTLQWHRCLEE